MSLLTKNDAIKNVALKTGVTQAHVKKVIESLFEEVQQALSSGNRVEFRGFGIWELRMGKARIGRNPSNPDAGDIRIPARPTLRFKLGKDLKTAVADSNNHST